MSQRFFLICISFVQGAFVVRSLFDVSQRNKCLTLESLLPLFRAEASALRSISMLTFQTMKVNLPWLRLRCRFPVGTVGESLLVWLLPVLCLSLHLFTLSYISHLHLLLFSPHPVYPTFSPTLFCLSVSRTHSFNKTGK